MSIECVKLFLQPNPHNKNIDWKLGIEYREDVPTTKGNKIILQQMYEVFNEILKHEKRLAPLPSSKLPLEEPVRHYEISQYEVDWEWGKATKRFEVVRYTRSYPQSSLANFGLLRIYPVPAAASPTFFYLLLKIILTSFEHHTSDHRNYFLKQEGWDFLFNDFIVRKYFFNDPELSDNVSEHYGIIRS